MARLLVHVEGPTEEDFVNEVLADYLRGCGYGSVTARIVGNARERERRASIATTMVDFYGLPQEGQRAWPGRKEAARMPADERAPIVERALETDVAAAMGRAFDSRRFVPFVVMHEFEGLLFSDCAAFSQAIGRPGLEAAFAKIRAGFPTPEEINDSPVTAPSKRVLDLVPGYEKPLLGSLAAIEIGLETIRRECPHFNDWISRLEAAGSVMGARRT